MLIFAMALATSSLPAFDTGSAIARCVDESDAGDFDAQTECMTGRIRDYRELSAVYRYAKPALREAIDRCVAEYSEDGAQDWNMIQICANEDETLLVEVSIADGKFDAGRARAHCQREQQERPGVVPAECFKDAVIGNRNFTLFKAVYPDARMRAPFALCLDRWTKDGLTDWDMVSYCAQDQLDGVEQLARLYPGGAPPPAKRAAVTPAPEPDAPPTKN